MSREELIFTWLKNVRTIYEKLRAKDRVVFIEKTFDNMEYEIDNLFKFYNEQELKENDKMFDVNNVHVGDYVETRDGMIGYITKLDMDFSTLFHWHDIGSNRSMYVGAEVNLNKCFKQIGTYKFEDEKTVNHKKPIERIRYCAVNNNKIYNTSKKFFPHYEELTIPNIIDKLNEVIDKLNEME